MRRTLAILPWLLLLLAVVDWLALRRGWLGHGPSALAALVALVLAALVARLVIVAASAARRQRAVLSGLGECLALGGILVALLAGLANWLLGLSGYVILNRGETMPLSGGSHLQALHGGPLARTDALEVELTLVELELLPAGSGTFHPRSRLLVARAQAPPEELLLDTSAPGRVGTLRLHQGAFGFSPHVVVLRDDATVFDRVVPFTSRRSGPEGIAFEGSFTVEAADLEVAGRVDLTGLDPAFRGHARLDLSLSHEGRSLGSGRLQPGHFAELADGFRVGFAGLETWSEVVVSRRTYTELVLAGAALALAGLMIWPLAHWRGW